MPTVSIITPAYNAAPFVVETLDSALRQTFSDFEILVVDDGSTDETAALISEVARRDPRVRLIRRKNGGISEARNSALSHCTGEFFALLDSDDLWFPECLERQLEILRSRPEIDVLSANCLNLGGTSDGKPLKPVGAGDVVDLTLLDLVRSEDSMCILSVFRRQVADTIGGFDPTFRGSEDYDFWLRAASAGFRLGFNRTPLGYYRRRPDSMSADVTAMLHTIVRALNKLRADRAQSPELTEAIDRQLLRFRQQERLEGAKRALVLGDRAAVETHLTALRDLTGSSRYATAAWLSRNAPRAITWAYAAKRFSRWITQAGRRIVMSR